MLFLVEYQARPNNAEDWQKRSLQVFSKWKPPAGSEITAHYACADGRGFAIVQAESAAPLLETVATYSIWFDYKVTPIVEIREAVSTFQRAISWRDSVR
jgi:hypothetical protein